MSQRISWLLTLLGLMVLACSGPTEPVAIATIQITAPSTTIPSGATVQLTAATLSKNGKALNDRVVTWSSSNQSIATVSATGLVTAGSILGGTAEAVTITASAEGITGTASIAINPVPAARLAISNDSVMIRVGDSLRLDVRIVSAGEVVLTGRDIEWRTLDSTVARVSQTGMVNVPTNTGGRFRSTRLIVSHQQLSDTAVVVARPLAPTLTVTTTDTLVRVGQSATLRWNSQYAITCQGDGLALSASGPSGELVIRPDSGGRRMARMVCVGDGGSKSDSTVIKTPFTPGKTSYQNFKSVSVDPKDIAWGTIYPMNARAYADFSQDGEYGLVTADIQYSIRDSINPPPAKVAFWRAQGSAFVLDNRIQVQYLKPMCIHPRKIIIADFNADERPDAFIACHGYDAGSFPGERSMVLLSTGNARYQLDAAAPDVGFWHGATAADINGDGRSDVFAVTDSGRVAVFMNNGDGRFTRDSNAPAGTIRGSYFNIELVDVDEDGKLDLFLGGHEWWQGETTIFLGDGSYRFDGSRRVIPPIPDIGGVITDILVTGHLSDRTLWILRTSGGGETFYHGVVIQRYTWATANSAVVFQRAQPTTWVDWLFSYNKANRSCIGSDMNIFALEYCP